MISISNGGGNARNNTHPDSIRSSKKPETTATMCCDFQELKFKNYQSNILAFHCNCKAVHKTSDFSSSVQLKNRFKFFFQATLNPIRHMHI